MADSENARVDPRFDPLYQRGYAPSVDATRQVSGRRATAPGPIYPAPPPELDAGGPPRSASAVENSLDPVGSSPEDAAGRAPLVSGLNPYVRALAIMSVAFVVLGAGAAVWANSASWAPSSTNGRTAIQMQIIQNLVLQFSTPVVTVGFAIGVGLVFLKFFTSRAARPIHAVPASRWERP